MNNMKRHQKSQAYLKLEKMTRRFLKDVGIYDKKDKRQQARIKKIVKGLMEGHEEA